ncbi:transposase, partial [Burkholderia ubonensis]
MVEQTFEPDASVSLVARCNDINTNLLFRWP